MNTIFRDINLYNQVKEQGFVKTNLLNNEEVQTLKQSYLKLTEKLGGLNTKQFWPSGRHSDVNIRNFAKSEIEKIVPHKLEKLVDRTNLVFIGGSFLLKPPSWKSSLAPHQDSSHVDERNGFSIYAWIPLQNVNRLNGCFHYLPGSHLWGIHQRSLNVKWALKDKAKILQNFMKPISMKAGEVLFFHSALIHSSPPNYSFKTRVAVNYYIHPADSPFCHFYEDETTEPGKVEMYQVTPEFFYNENFEERPDKTKYPLLEIIDKSPFNWDEIEKSLKTLR